MKCLTARKKWVIALKAVAAAAIALFSVCAAALADPPNSTTVPFTLVGDIPVIDAQIDRHPARFSLETGMAPGFITSSFAARLGLRVVPGSIDGQTMAYGEPMRQAVLSQVQIGSLVFRDIAVDVNDSVPPQGADGAFSGSLFWQTAALFDFPRSRFTIWSAGNLTKAERAKAGMDGVASVPLTHPTEAPYYTLPVRFGAMPAVDCALITGLPSFLSGPVARGLNLKPYAPMLTETSTGPGRVLVAPVTHISVGGVALADPRARYPVSGVGAEPPILGGTALAGCRVLVDMPARKLYLKRAVPLAAPSPKATWTVSSLPMQVRSRVPEFGVTLPDGKVHWFLFTLGGAGSTVDRAVAARQGLKPQPVPGVPGAQTVRMITRLGSEKPMESDWILADLHNAPFNLGPHVDGILGANFLSQIGLSVDVTHSAARVFDPGGGAVFPLPPPGWQEVPMTWGKEGAYEIPVEIDGKTIQSALSLDKALTLIGDPSLAPPVTHPTASADLRWTGPPALHIERLHFLKIGNVTLQAPVVIQYVPAKTGGPALPNVIGWSILARYDLLIEPGVNLISIHRDLAYSPGSEQEWQGVGLYWSRNLGDEVTAREVLNPSPASEAGMKPGDVITAVNGKDVKTIADDALARLLENPRGPKITLTLRRTGAPGPITVSMVPRNLLAAPAARPAPEK
ncbi:MAG TPA: aspartyl protease family protein [Armatimonadota bacterium]|nr:aspartyl protease family protein [Armatimonadota bacterium]